MEAHGELMIAIAGDSDGELKRLGTEIGKLYTNRGVPIDMCLDRLLLPKQQKLAVLAGALDWLVEHRRASSATDKAIDRLRKSNREVMERFVLTGEVGLY